MTQEYPVPEVIGQRALFRGEELRDEGIQRVSQKPERQAWLQTGLRLIARIGPGELVTADDVRRHLPEPPHPNLTGALFRKAKAEGLVEAVGIQQSESPSRHASLQRVWRRVA